MKRDVLKFLSGVAAAASVGHIAAAVATWRGLISVPIWRGREWGIGKMLTEAVVYGAIGAGLGYLAWRPEAHPVLQAEPEATDSPDVADRLRSASA